MKSFLRLLAFTFLCVAALTALAADDFLPGVQRIVFLGDSITHGGTYVSDFETFLFVHFPQRKFEVINVGLSSETVSGLSEEGHAGGKFPRPDLHERLDRVLAKAKPDLVFACYGMNDGIYLPLEESRFAKFRDGMNLLHKKVTDAGAKIIHLTPPTFDPGPKADAAAFNYNTVLDRYATWLLDQRKEQGWQVFDIHGPMNAELASHRAASLEFVYAKDHIHPNAEGHWIMARELLRGLGQPTDDFTTDPRYADLLKLVHQRSRVLGDAWLTFTEHKRPGVGKGLPIDEANAKAAELETKIREKVAALK